MSKYAKRTGWTVVATAGLAFICTVAQGWAEQFTIAVIPDTQVYSTSDANMAGFTAQMNYIATNRVSRNIVFATHLGDMVNDNGGVPDQWRRARTAMNILRDSDVPFGIAIGNHDYDSGSSSPSGTAVWAGYFGPGSTYFQGRPWYRVRPGNVPDSYQIFYGADRAFLHIVLELEPSTASLQWAQQIIQAYPGLPTIVSLHEYLECNGNRSGSSYRGGSSGLQIWQNFVSPNSQIFMVLCGHTFDLNNGVGRAQRTSINSAGKAVYELLSDYQLAGDTGSGFMRFMEFDSALQCINVTTYSPLLDTRVTDSSSQFTLSFDWNDRFGPAPAGLPPLIITQPMNQTVSPGREATFRVFATGSAPLAYQWYFNGTNLEGATDPTYTTHNVALADSGSQFSCLVSNAYGTMLSSNAVLTAVIRPTDYFTALFDTAISNLAFHTYTFTPNGTVNFYEACSELAATFPIDPTGGSELRPGDNDYAKVALSDSNSVAIYGTRSDVLYVGSNGYLTLGSGGKDRSPSYTVHFDRPQISALYRDLNPSGGGTVTWKQLSDRVAVTYQDVPIYGSNDQTNSFQVEMFWDGRIRITYLELNTPSGLVGLSAGTGVPMNFVPSDLAAYVPCGPQPPVIMTQPTDETVPVGGAATYSVAAFGSLPLSYSWMRNGVPIAGASSSTYTTNDVRSAGSGSLFSCLVTNPFGSGTTHVATLTVLDPAIISQPVSQDKNLGESVTFSVAAVGTPPLSYQWWKDGVALAQSTGASLTLANLQASDAGSYRVAVSGPNGSVTSVVAVLAVNLVAADTFNPGANSDVYCLAEQADGRILVGGTFTTLGGQTRNRIGRLNSDGTLDTTFNPGAAGGDYTAVYALALQEDGKIVVGGTFTTLGNGTRKSIGRLNSDGTLDTTFNPGVPGVYGLVLSLAVQADGKILVGGYFTTLGGHTRNNIGRLNSDGTLDTTFNPGAAGGSRNYGSDVTLVYSLVVQADGKTLVGGTFTRLGGYARNYIGRLNSNGTVDTTFNPGANNEVQSLAVQADGKILVGGKFTTLGGQTRNYIGRLNSNGTLDTTFNPGADGYVRSLAVQADGKILVDGYFTMLGGQTRNYIGRLNADGTLDTHFNPGTEWGASSLALQADGRILAGGWSGTLGGQPRSNIGRLNNTEPATQSLSYDGATLTWLRGGTSPEVWRATLDVSPNGTDWLSLGAGTRIIGLPNGPTAGWQWTNVSVSVGSILRARGFVSGGSFTASSWFVETAVQVGPEVFAPGIYENRFGASIRAVPGHAVVIEASTNLMQWTAIQTNAVASSGVVFFADPESSGLPQRFYRVSERP